MKVLVAVKRVIDPNVRVRVLSDKTGVETAGVKHALNPFCEIAIEAALRLREAGSASEVVLVSVGSSVAQETLRAGLAMGADRAILVETDEALEPLNIAKVLKAVVNREAPSLVLLGKQAVDDDSNQTGQMLAGMLNWPQATFAAEIEPGVGDVLVRREVDTGQTMVRIRLPGVITTDLRLNQPRFASLPNIMKAKSKPLDRLRLDDIAPSLRRRQQCIEIREPARRAGGIRVASASELVEKLKVEAKVL